MLAASSTRAAWKSASAARCEPIAESSCARRLPKTSISQLPRRPRSAVVCDVPATSGE